MKLIKLEPQAKEISDDLEVAPEVHPVDMDKLRDMLPTHNDKQIARVLKCHPSLVKVLRLKFVGCKPDECGISWDELNGKVA